MVTRHTIPPTVYFFPQPVYLVGVYREDGQPTFSMHTWMTTASTNPPTIMFAVYRGGQGIKRTADRVLECGLFSVNLVTTPMIPYADYCGSVSGYVTDKCADAQIPWAKGEALEVPVLSESPWVYECRLVATQDVGECKVLFGEVLHTSVDVSVTTTEWGKVPVPSLQPAVYSAPAYYSLGPQVYSVGESLTTIKGG